MKLEVSTAIDELKRQFESASCVVREDGQGGAFVILEPIALGERFAPRATWIGFHIPALYPYADIYPVFIGAEVTRANGNAFQAPVTNGHRFENRPAIQVSRRSAAAQAGSQKAVAKILKVMDFLDKLA